MPNDIQLDQHKISLLNAKEKSKRIERMCVWKRLNKSAQWKERKQKKKKKKKRITYIHTHTHTQIKWENCSNEKQMSFGLNIQRIWSVDNLWHYLKWQEGCYFITKTTKIQNRPPPPPPSQLFLPLHAVKIFGKVKEAQLTKINPPPPRSQYNGSIFFMTKVTELWK